MSISKLNIFPRAPAEGSEIVDTLGRIGSIEKRTARMLATPERS